MTTLVLVINVRHSNPYFLSYSKRIGDCIVNPSEVATATWRHSHSQESQATLYRESHSEKVVKKQSHRLMHHRCAFEAVSAPRWLVTLLTYPQWKRTLHRPKATGRKAKAPNDSRVDKLRSTKQAHQNQPGSNMDYGMIQKSRKE